MDILIVRLALITLIALAGNLPFGYLREDTKKFSFYWFLYIHLPIPFIIYFRKTVFDLSFHYIPIILAGAVLGQIVGARYRRRVKARV
ncbi:MAG: hypothetical protein ACE5D4_09695 [Thermodesulfobacteriota bacterium]